jgi:hypothetical protein
MQYNVIHVLFGEKVKYIHILNRLKILQSGMSIGGSVYFVLTNIATNENLELTPQAIVSD